MDIDEIIRRARRDSRRVSGSETRALCDEIERLRAALAEARSACTGMSTFLTNEQLAWACDTWPWVGGDEAARAAGGEK